MKNKTTIKELSQICGVSEQSIRKWCRKHNIGKDDNNKYLLSNDVKVEILRNYGCETTKPCETKSAKPCETIKTLKNTEKVEKCETKSAKPRNHAKPSCETSNPKTLKFQYAKPPQLKTQLDKKQNNQGLKTLGFQYAKPCETTKPSCETNYNNDFIEFLKEQIKEKDKQLESKEKQLEVKDKQIDSLNDRLKETIKLMDQEQQLRLVAEQQLEKKQLIIENHDAQEIKPWWKFWK